VHAPDPDVPLEETLEALDGRSAELDLLPFCRAAGLGVIPWGPLGAGFLTGRYRRGEQPPEGSRMAGAGDDWEEAPHRRAIERNFRVVDAAEAIAAERGVTVPQVAIAWLLGVEGVTAPILGPRTMEQLEGILGADEISLTGEERARLEAPAPPPELYPHRMLAEQVGMSRMTPPLRRRGGTP
jgi:aryl-alcohol dehydrogenase-like predicted oxidoreductase